jgi:hypothetical protein
MVKMLGLETPVVIQDKQVRALHDVVVLLVTDDDGMETVSSSSRRFCHGRHILIPFKPVHPEEEEKNNGPMDFQNLGGARTRGFRGKSCKGWI